MSDWAVKWLGRRWTRAYRCEDFYLEVLREEFGRDASFGPRASAPPAAWDRLVVEGKPRYLRQLGASELEEGDAVLMTSLGSDPPGSWHIGAFVRPWATLHLPIGAASIVTPLAAVHSLALEIEGFYRCR